MKATDGPLRCGVWVSLHIGVEWPSLPSCPQDGHTEPGQLSETLPSLMGLVSLQTPASQPLLTSCG